jgi:ABC-type sugar transport system ATPase subunit
MAGEMQPLWELESIHKHFPGVKALDGVDVRIFPGEVHGLLGENGSGKSTLVKCLSGVHQPTAGRILLRGSPTVIHDPFVARSLGIATIYQELSLVPNLTVAENIFLGRLPRRGLGVVVDWSRVWKRSEALLERLGIQLDPGAVVADLSVSEQQTVEIAKALSQDASLLIMDEPTASLGMDEVTRLHDIVRNLARQGCAVIYISHRLDEVAGLVDSVTVMKDGKVVANERIGNIDMARIVNLMIGGDFRSHYPKERNRTDEVLLEVEDISTARGVRGATFTVHRGEVVGFAGLIGTGRTSIAHALFGIDRVTGGRVTHYGGGGPGRDSRFSSPGRAIADGVALLTEDRKSTGLFMNFTGVHNISIARLSQISRGGVLDLGREQSLVQAHFENLRITPTARDRSVQFLSGGNQQKVIIARWIFSEADVFILDEPTQGIDVGAKVEVYNLVNALTREGKGVILISSDLEELLAISDTICVVSDGRIVESRRAEEIDRKYLMEKVFTRQAGEKGSAWPEG